MAGILVGPATQPIPLWTLLAALGVAVVASIGVIARLRNPWVSLVPLAAIAVFGIVRHRVFHSYSPWHLSRWRAEDLIVYVRGVVVEEPLAVNRGAREATASDALDVTEGEPAEVEEDSSCAEKDIRDESEVESKGANREESADSSTRAGKSHHGREFATSFVVDAKSLRFPAESFWRPVEGFLLVKFFGPLEGLQYGTEVRMLGRMKGLPAPRNPGERNYRTALERRGIYRQFVVSKRCDIWQEGWGGGGLIMQIAADIRREMSKAIEKHVSPDQRALVACMLLGIRRAVPDEIEENMQMTGTIHVLAVSGLHVFMIASFFMLVLRLLAVPRRFRAMLGILFLATYCVVAGARAPVVRASVMTGTLFLAQLLRRRADLLNLLALSAIAILAVRPTQLYEVGFQLSFTAVLCLLFLGTWFQTMLAQLFRRLGKSSAAIMPGGTSASDTPHCAFALARTTTEGIVHRVRNYITRWMFFAFTRSAAVWAGMAGLVLFYFNVVTPVAVLANIILAPLVFLFLAFGLTTVLASFVLPGAVAGGVGWCTTLLGRAIESAVTGMAAIPGGSFFLPAPSRLSIVTFYFALIFLLLSTRVRKCLLIAACGAVICIVSMLRDYWPPPRPEFALKATVLDVGHGLSVLIETADGVSVLYDAGGTRFLDVGRQVIAPFLWNEKKCDIDILILSHADWDHISGVPALFRRFSFGEVRAAPDFDEAAWRSRGASEEFEEKFREKLRKAQPPFSERFSTSSEADGTNLDFFWPDDRIVATSDLSRNNRSLVVKISSRGRSVLLPGDIEESGLRWLRGTSHDLRADVLILPHHGGADSWCPEFAQKVQARVAIASRRQKMTEDEATARIAEAYAALGTRVVETATAGATTVILWPDGHMEVSTFLTE